MKSPLGLSFAILAMPALAENHLAVAPQYYLDTVIGMSLAEQYAWHCTKLDVSGEAMGVAYAGVLEQLASEGIPTDAPHEHMLLPPAAETDAMITDMLERNQAADDPATAFCSEARAEMAAGSIVGSFLQEIQ